MYSLINKEEFRYQVLNSGKFKAWNAKTLKTCDIYSILSYMDLTVDCLITVE